MRKLCAVLLMLLVAVACSSTNQADVAQRSTVGKDASDAQTRGDSTASLRAAGASRSGTAEVDYADGSGQQAPDVASRSVVVPTGGTLKLGVHLSANGAAAAAFGVTLPAHSPAKVDAIVNWINQHGGIDNRRVEVVYHTTDPLRGSFDQQAQEACTDLTQDHKVHYAISAAQVYRDSLPACFAQNKTPFVWSVFYLTQRSVVPVSYLYRPSNPHADRLGFVVDGLVRHGFFRNAKIALMRYDSPKEKKVADTVFKPALAARGLKLTEEVALREPDSASQASDTAAEASSAALRLRQAGVTHVLFVPSGGAIPLLFLAAAESQNYRPKYGFSSMDAPYFVRDSVPKAQLEGAVGVGWAPPVDLGPTSREAQNFSPGMKLCVQISQKAGYAPNEAPVSYCDMLFFLRTALRGAGATTIDALQEGAQRASGYPSSLTFGARFAPGRHDGPAVARTFVWDTDWKYVGEPYDIG